MKTLLQKVLVLCTILSASALFAQGRIITGTVTEANGPLPGATVVIKGTSTGTQTDFDGNFSIEAASSDVLSFSYVGFKTLDIQVGNQNSINATLEADNSLEEVVITGYGSRSRDLSTAATTTVSAGSIEDFVPSTSVDNILQGKAAGVQVTAANGQPGQTAFVQIRGLGSINAATTPLYVIDGAPIEAEFVNNINPNDIETLTILKDAATVSKYGSRGANGVILITTKRGRSKDAKFVLRSSLGTSERIADPFDIMNAAQKLELERQYAALGVPTALGLPGATATPEQLAQFIENDTNWEDALLRDGFVQSNSLSISGADEKINYFLSLGYDKNTGIIDRIDGFERISARLNTTYQARDWLSVGTNISASRSTTDLPRDRNNVQNPFRFLYDANPYETLFLRDGNNEIVTNADGEPQFNPTTSGFPVAQALQTEPETNTNFLLVANIFADLKFSDKFSNRFAVGTTTNRGRTVGRSIAGGTLDPIVGDSNFPGTQRESLNVDFQYNVSNVFGYKDTFGEKHNISADVLLEYNERIFTRTNVSGRGFPTPDIPFLDVAADFSTGGSTEVRNSLFSQGLFVDYDYDGKYLLSASVRNDASSRFGPENQNAIFYSGSAAWNIAREDFMEGSVFNDLKLRASYGSSGNQNIGNNQFVNLIGFDTYNGNSSAVPGGIANPDIKWEQQFLADIGVEFGLFNNRISGVVDYYVKTSEDLLLNRPISGLVGDGNNGILSNIGEIENSGLEVALNFDAIKTEDWRVSLGGNIAFLDNEVKELVNGEDINNGNTILRVGEEINTFFLVEYAGVNPANGEPLYLTADGDVTNQYSADFARTLEGKSPLANIEGGFYGNIRYKGFGLRGDFVFKAGNYIQNFQRSAGVSIGNIDANQRVEAFNYWQQPGDQNVLPNPLYEATADQTSTRFLEKGDYVRLRTLTLSYDVPSQLLEKTGLSSVRLYGTGQNLLTFTDYEGDPEIGIGSAENSGPGDAGFVAGQFSLFSYPQTKSLTFGVDIGF
ncbi:SusC/RagA family TonB-linked outer membrane protein [uncultured Dokdonia sp.]|uniref:SusC/RagA family TonB-linked outer membrane protein n=1 Tax=uncultured Dokdonia sp. TaxID=575653 RepID=UPI0030EE4C7D|tara:strand:+ start:2339 stop:5368 length:3030 start_codon:yes stop_codon:yes gene_type:complete